MFQVRTKCATTTCDDCEFRKSEGVCTINLIADHLLANGVIVPPCKVGDKVYFIDSCKTAEDFGKEYVSWSEVLQLTFNCFGEWVLLTDKRLLDMGEVFLTKEEAEAKLRGVQNDRQ